MDSLGQKVFLHFGVYSMLSKKSSSFWAKLLKFYHKISVGQDQKEIALISLER